MSLLDAAPVARVERFPRVSGDEPATQMPIIMPATFSPRERG